VGEFDHLVVNEERERAIEELAGLVRELTGCPDGGAAATPPPAGTTR
jgi:hypothetical protein